jgi:hypothetical protein
LPRCNGPRNRQCPIKETAPCNGKSTELAGDASADAARNILLIGLRAAAWFLESLQHGFGIAAVKRNRYADDPITLYDLAA